MPSGSKRPLARAVTTERRSPQLPWALNSKMTLFTLAARSVGCIVRNECCAAEEGGVRSVVVVSAAEVLPTRRPGCMR